MESALGNERIAGVWKGMTPHTLYSEVLNIAKDVKTTGADCIVTIGGGTLVDGAKTISLALANDTELLDIEGFDQFLKSIPDRRDKDKWNAESTDLKSSVLPIICVTTTLSAGEYNPAAGATHDTKKHKLLFQHPTEKGPRVIIWDPELTLTTPEKVWISTGLRAMDHCVETFCSSNPSPEGSAYASEGLKLLLPALLKTKENPNDLEARLDAQKGGALSMKPTILEGVRVGGSHGIGHQLGPLGVPHAETTCVLLPAVQKYNAKVNAAQQADLVNILWDDPTVASGLTKRKLTRGKNDLGDVLDAIIRELGFSRTLKDHGVGRDKLEMIAVNSVDDICCTWNAISLVRKEQILEILEMCVGNE